MNVIAHNISALNAQRQFNINTNLKAKSAEKLSSGYRINRAADDAAGLSISEKMRAQIRGLDQGRQNITDGISLVQTAEGALVEITSMIQRINELSIQAYNGTNSKSDRESLQAEVSQILDEIVRVADTTKFNEIPLLKGNPIQRTTIASAEEIPYTFDLRVDKTLPSWITYDKDLEKHDTYTGLQDMTGIMLQTNADGTVSYWGPDDADLIASLGLNISSISQWNPDISDNPSAKINFEGLTNASSAEDLYTKMFELIGCSIHTPCGTCNQEYTGIEFTATDLSNIHVEDVTYISGSGYNFTDVKLDLSTWKVFEDDEGNKINCFDKINSLIVKHTENTTISEQDKLTEVQKLADDIAKRLCTEVCNKMNTPENTSHFIRTLKDGDYSIIMYDYRDVDALTHMQAADSKVLVDSCALFQMEGVYLTKGTTIDAQTPIKIIGSANEEDIIPINLPLISLEALGLDEYDIANYEVTETYSAKYAAKLEEWRNNVQYIDVTEQYNQTKLVLDHIDFINGEVSPVFNKVTTTATRTYKKAQPLGPKPKPEEGDITRTTEYVPSSISILEDALAYVLKARSNLGATQNRLEHAYNNNYNTQENTTAAESRIRDVDMASEMLSYSKQNILDQISQSIISQANQSRQGILQLLQ